jgi:hypothetical protein
MDVKQLHGLAKQFPEASKQAAEGFEERLAQRKEQFRKEAEKQRPKGDFYNRRYDI